ncbi:hypothetical protein SOV_40830 [Sporomusa ovata DSM 2662]|uniref:Spore protein YkvP/CgeB glycosyl transferase-like domain-containing protein n=1 Tax=Sporomusa ovata TaxID=2378 RepID=A0A0U1KTH1_9FIRM|nr:glycosyl transferase group 1 [Sporomusa ovata]EQB26471.1 glycosyl transferase group 1 [Sporomusa ovata DSM 2662]CQR70555.1 hypothetical protein SpAn4DRAFT_1524 [Sporomusa ovata]
MNIIYSAKNSWYKNWFRFELLLELNRLGHQVTYVAPQTIGQFVLNSFKNKVQRNISYKSVKYKPYIRLSKKNWAAERKSLQKTVGDILIDKTIFISNDFKKCAEIKAAFNNKIIVVYDMYDRYSEYGNEHYTKNQIKIEQFDKAEQDAIAKCDLLLCASTTLADETRQVNNSVLWFPNAVPQDYIIRKGGKHSRKIIGMLSDRMSRINQELLREVAEKLPEYKFELVGKNDIEGQNSYPSNVIFKAYMPHHELLEYITNWDCGFSLYNDNRFNYYCCPMKYFEYSSRNLPVITTPIPEAKVFAALYSDIVYLADGALNVIEQVKRLELKPKDTDFTKLAIENTWKIRAEQLATSLLKFM